MFGIDMGKIPCAREVADDDTETGVQGEPDPCLGWLVCDEQTAFVFDPATMPVRTDCSFSAVKIIDHDRMREKGSQAMITQVSIKNFKCLRDVTVKLEPFTVFVGANGSGKTSILQALDLLCRTFRVEKTEPGYHGKMIELEMEFQQNRYHGTTEEVELSFEMSENHFRYQALSLAQQIEKRQKSHVEIGDGPEFANHGDPLIWKQLEPQNGMLPNPVWLRLDPNILRQPTQGQDIRAMGNNGQGMHRALSSMMLERRNDFFKLEADLMRIVPSVKQLQPTAEHEIRFHTINGKGLKADQISEGTLLTLGLLTAIHSVNRPGLLLLDDLDRALHPKAQRELIDLLRGVQQTNPEIQIAASTHSPYMLDSMKPNEVLVTYLRDDGSTACDSLTHHPKFEKWKDEFQPGEMWSFFRENWVAKPEVAAK
jgi:predicted ATPase